MGFLGKTKAVKIKTSEAKDEKEKAKAKARLLGTEGENRGEELQAKQGASVRKVFGN